AALWTARRPVAVGLVLVAGTGFLTSGALHQHAAALAIGDQTALTCRLERLLDTRSPAVLIASFARHRPREIRAGECCDLLSELLAQYARLDLLDLTFGQFAQLERPVGDPDQPVHLEAEMRHHVAHFAIFSFADCK